MNAHDLRDAIRGLAFAIAYDADAIANDRLTADPHAAALLLKNNADTLVAWTGKLREQEQPAVHPVYVHVATPDDLPEPGDRCKICGENITWIGPGSYDWQHVADQKG